MNSLEDRLRAALEERAGQSPVSPDAWSRTVARARRGSWAPAWTRFVIPVAAAVATIAIIIGAAVLTGHRSPGRTGVTGPTVAPASATATPPPPPGPNDYLMKAAPPVTAVVPVKLVIRGKTTWTFVWFGRQKQTPGGIQLCSETYGDGYGGSGGCEVALIPAGKIASSGGGSGAIRLGTVVRQATSVTVLLSGDRRVPGMLVSGRAFPYQVWMVTYSQPANAQVVFAGSGGRKLGQLSFPASYPTPHQPRTGGITVLHYPAGTLEPFAGTVTAYLLPGQLVGVSGQVVGFWDSNSSSEISNIAAAGPPAVRIFGGNVVNRARQAYLYGYAHENVRRVALRLAGGKQYGAQTSAAWAGSGLRLWAFQVPASTLLSATRPVMLGYDADGRVIWQQKL